MKRATEIARRRPRLEHPPASARSLRCRSSLVLLSLVFCLVSFAPSAAEPVLARLHFQVPPDSMEVFARLYDEELRPRLGDWGLRESTNQGRPTQENYFTCLFEFDSLDQFVAAKQRFQDGKEAWTWFEGIADGFGWRGKQYGFQLYSLELPPPKVVVAPSPRGSWYAYDASNGLNYSSVQGIFTHWDLSIWVQSDRGVLSRFDGQGWHVQHIPALDRSWQYWSTDRDGNQWFARTGNMPWNLPAKLARWDGETVRFFGAADGLDVGPIQHFEVDHHGVFWLETKKGLLCYDGRTTFVPPGLEGLEVSIVLVDREGAVWLWNAAEGALLRYADHTWSVIAAKELPAGYLVAAQDPAGRIWLGTSQGLYVFDGGGVRATSVLAEERIRRLFVDRRGDLWATVYDLGVYHIRVDRGFQVTRYTTADGLAGNSIFDIVEDGEGSIWVSTNGGASRFDRALTTYTTADGLVSDEMAQMAQDSSGTLWMTSRDGFLSRFDGTRFASYARLFYGALLLTPAGDLWINGIKNTKLGWYSGLGRLRDRHLSVFGPPDGVDGSGSHHLSRALRDRKGHLWFNRGVVVRFDGRTFSSYSGPEGGLGYGLLEDSSGTLWAGGEATGVHYLDGDRFVPWRDPASRLDSVSVWSVAEGVDGALWFGTYGDGLIRYLPEGASDPKDEIAGATFTSYSVNDGLSTSMIMSASLLDRRGRLWFATDGGGVILTDGRTFQSLTRADGLAGNVVRSILEDDEGNIWFGCSGGLTRYTPPPASHPPVFVDAVVADRRYASPAAVSLPSGTELVAFEFHGMSFKTRPGAMVYRYRLLGFDDDWRTTRAQRVEYDNLPRGDYSFEVVAVDRDLGYSPEPARVALEVTYQPVSSTCYLTDLRHEPLFASFATVYADQPFGAVKVVNDAPDSVEAILRYTLPEFMRRPAEQALQLAPQSSQVVELKAPLKASLLEVTQTLQTEAEVELSFAVGEQIFAMRHTPPVTVYGRGALCWDQVGRAAAFITSEDPTVAAFARSPLVAFEAQTKSLGLPGKNLLQAMVLFETLKEHGIRYLADANTSYDQRRSDQSAIDHIQYPAQVLQHKSGDCDDLTVLFCALLENAGIATALVDYPKHIFLLFDTGLGQRAAYQLPLAARQYIKWQDRIWIPLEMTLLDRSFIDAWQAGVAQLAGWSGLEQRRRLVRTAEAWAQFPPSNPNFEAKVEPPAPRLYEQDFSTQYEVLEDQIRAYIDDRYIDPLKVDPANAKLRSELGRLYIALQQYDSAIEAAYDYLRSPEGKTAATYNHLGIVYYFKEEYKQAAFYLENAAVLAPEDAGIQRNLARVKAALGEGEASAETIIEDGGAAGTKDAAAGENADDFYWVE